MSDLEGLETIDDGEPPSLRSWNDRLDDDSDLEYETLRWEYQKREVDYLYSIGIRFPGDWVTEMNAPSSEKSPVERNIETKRKLGRWSGERFFRIISQ